SDYCCTSSNAVEIVQSIPEEQEILVLPDMFLGDFVQRETGRKNMHIWMGECHVHAGIEPDHVDTVLKENRDDDLLERRDCGCSTSSMYLKLEGNNSAYKTDIIST